MCKSFCPRTCKKYFGPAKKTELCTPNLCNWSVEEIHTQKMLCLHKITKVAFFQYQSWCIRRNTFLFEQFHWDQRSNCRSSICWGKLSELDRPHSSVLKSRSWTQFYEILLLNLICVKKIKLRSHAIWLKFWNLGFWWSFKKWGKINDLEKLCKSANFSCQAGS